ncbi:MAG TPA: DUF6687 family protein [Pyrinomonadaceae bacterium]|nr:DUF6687 family protein [Pyrinomonadaceae bacterium]
MRFEFYHEALANVPKLSVDGTVDNAVHLSHWEGNTTPAELRADTSTEIALNFVASPRREEIARGIEIVTNNHFDTDGLLSVWTTLAGARALELRDKLVAAAEAGDFSEFPNAQAVRASLTVQGGDNPFVEGVASPLARELAGGASVDERRAYKLLLPEVERVLTRTDEYEPLWRESWSQIESALESFASGRSRVEEDAESRMSVVMLAPDLYGASGFKPTRHAAPYTAIAHNARGEIFLIATPAVGGWSYRIDYPYYSWAMTFVRPRVARRDLSRLVLRLNEMEGDGGGSWKADRSELTSAVKFTDAGGVQTLSRLEPDAVAAELRAVLIQHSAPAAKGKINRDGQDIEVQI